MESVERSRGRAAHGTDRAPHAQEAAEEQQGEHMSFSDSYDNCMAQKHLPLLGELFSRKTLSEAVALLHEVHSALEAAGGPDITLAALAAASSSLGLTAEGAELVAILAAGAGNLAAHLYFVEAVSCMARAVIKENLLSELETAPAGFIKDQIGSAASEVGAVA